MIADILLIFAFVVGVVSTACIIVPLWRDDRRKIDELLGLLEAKAAPVEYAAYLAPPQPITHGDWISTDDGLISYPYDDGDD